MGQSEQPLVVELRRGPLRESAHTTHAVVVDVNGAVVHSWGDTDLVMHPRSAAKPLQALPLIESGAADAMALGDVALALACASHNGEPAQITAVDRWLGSMGFTHHDLECGVQPGRSETATGNECSGKHAGLLSIAHHLGIDQHGYIGVDHPVQQLVTNTLAETTGADLNPANSGIDGCGTPVHPMPLATMALGAARFGAPPDSWHPDRRMAARRLGAAMVAEPWFVAGTDRLCTDLLADGEGDILVKSGAEGVQFAALPRLGLGIGIKVVDGSVPASEVALGYVLSCIEGEERAEVMQSRHEVRNYTGTLVGSFIVAR
jgi:L-asparaginase II